ncbi:katanin p60 ATPase-containing subunit A-like 2 [Orussus abietinus]|uniref:katanin p60 ATPase-containing subunit A-like 2 n=1 Tax=Orussus abietinus TaxID=222816 RepID=UPI0006256A38|nr:katanin p60 ATPase-containing subunit A-like 2 [Orussus abietinus]
MDCASLQVSSSKVNCLVREKAEKRVQERRRSLIYLIADYLKENRYLESAGNLAKEAQLSDDYRICDNVDLETILLEYSEYYYARYNKYPKICKKVDVLNGGASQYNKKEKINKNIRKLDEDNHSIKQKSTLKENAVPSSEPNLEIMVTPIFPNYASCEQPQNKSTFEANVFDNERIVKPIGDLYPVGSEWRELADVICREIVITDLNVHWNDIEGLDECKTILKEAAVYPMMYPSLFQGKMTPWQGILLYGPPGTGKTMLAKAVATECKSTFFNITSSSIVSKWRGDSEKYIRVLSDLAKYYAPTVIFIDEVDWTATGDLPSSNSEPSRRFRAELLARLDGLLSMESARVLLLAASNVPWDLDAALLRRLEKKILVDLPDRHSRSRFLQSFIHVDLFFTEEFNYLLSLTEGFSCADLKLLCKEAWMNQLRPIWSGLESKKITLNDVPTDVLITRTSFLTNALKSVKPLDIKIVDKYRKWQQSHLT